MAESLPRLSATATVDDVSAALDEAGAVIVERLASDELCDRITEELAPWFAATATGVDDFSGHNTRRTGALLARSPASVELIAHPLVLAAADRLLWGPKTTFQLHLTQAIRIGPGEPAQFLHRDQWCFDFYPFPDDVQVELATIWALTDFTEANGATRVVPGSHRLPDVGHLTPDDTVAAEMPRGSVVLYTGRTVHGGGANATDTWRTGINVDYSVGFLRQEENQYLSVPLDVARALPEPVQRLMGYSLGAYALGYVDDSRDPIAVLREDDTMGFAPRGATKG